MDGCICICAYMHIQVYTYVDEYNTLLHTIIHTYKTHIYNMISDRGPGPRLLRVADVLLLLVLLIAVVLVRLRRRRLLQVSAQDVRDRVAPTAAPDADHRVEVALLLEGSGVLLLRKRSARPPCTKQLLRSRAPRRELKFIPYFDFSLVAYSKLGFGRESDD